MSALKFIHQDLRQRSFRRHSLRGALFSHCDLRGATFHQADLQGASFVACRLGPSPQCRVIAALTLLTLTGLTFHAVSSMLFGALGTLSGDPAWPYVIALYSALAVATIGCGTLALLPRQTPLLAWARFSRDVWPVALARCLTGVATGALLGFFYGGSLTDNNAVMAVVSAVLFGLIGIGLASLAEYRQMRLVQAGLGVAGGLCTYGLALGLWTLASDALTTGALLPGVGWGAIALTCVSITLKSIGQGIQASQSYGTTSFRQANLTGCQFIQTSLKNCDVSETQGRFPDSRAS